MARSGAVAPRIMKGAVAAFAVAALDYVAANPAFKGSIGLLITGDEEGPAVNGTVKLLQWAAEQGEHFDHCLVGEPTNASALGDTIKIGRRGSLTGELTVHGTQGHVAYPQRADNPIPAYAAAARGLDRSPARPRFTAFRSKPSRNSHRRCRQSGNECHSGKGTRAFNIRFNDLWTPETLQAEIAPTLRSSDGWRALRFELSSVQRSRIRHRKRSFHRSGRRGYCRTYRAHRAFLDLGWHLRCALRSRLLPGHRIRPRRRNHAQRSTNTFRSPISIRSPRSIAKYWIAISLDWPTHLMNPKTAPHFSARCYIRKPSPR